MNLVAPEFVASRTDEQGVLLLSEFAGVSRILGQALIVNPYDIDGCAAAIHEAMTMTPEEQRSPTRLQTAQRGLSENTMGVEVVAREKIYGRKFCLLGMRGGRVVEGG